MEMSEAMDIEQMRKNATESAEFLKSMAHPERLMVLCQLSQSELGASELWEKSTLSKSAFSQQLKVLKEHHLVKVRKESQQVFYSLADERVKQLLITLHHIFCSK